MTAFEHSGMTKRHSADADATFGSLNALHLSPSNGSQYPHRRMGQRAAAHKQTTGSGDQNG